MQEQVPKPGLLVETWDDKMKKNNELLIMHKKLQLIEQSCWGRFFRFQKSSFFVSVEKKLTVYRTVRLRLDDILYIVLLAFACMVFYFLPLTDETHYLAEGFKSFLIFIMIFSVLWLISQHWFRHLFFAAVGILFPVLTFLIYNGIVSMDPVDTSASSTQLPQALAYFSPIAALVPATICLYLVYPIKQFIRNKIGSLYSYLFALSFFILFIIWPLYSLVQEYIQNQTLTFTFITQNQALIITFITIITFSFHLPVHNILFSQSIKGIRQYLRYDFSRREVNQALQEIGPQPLEESFVYRNFETYTRIMSGVVFLFTLLIEIYSFIYLSNNLDNILDGVAVMIFAVLFLLFGCLISLGKPRSLMLYLSSIICLTPLSVSALYYTLSFYRYVFLSCCFPYTAIFWCIIRSLTHRRPFLKTNITVILYILIHIPVTLFIVNNLAMITTDSTAQQSINYAIFAILGAVCVIGLVSLILWLRTTIKQLPKSQSIKEKDVDYNYFDPENPPYVPYKKDQTFSLAWLATLDIRNVSQLFSCICYIFSSLASFYVLNQLFFTIDSSTLYSVDSLSIIVAQLIITFIFFSYTIIYIILSIKSTMRIIYIVILWIVGLGLIGLSYSGLELASGNNFSLFAFRLIGGVMIGIGAIAIGLEIIKQRYHEIDNFLSGLICSLLWILVIIPYVIGIPIASVYVSIEDFGMFIYFVILGSILLMIILVSFVASIFNLLLGKFEQERKMKFLTEDISTYLKEEGVDTQNETMHILYESFEYRDKKYVYYLKRGYPVRLWIEKSSATQQDVKTIVYNQEQLMKKQSFSKIDTIHEQRDLCWRCLTCFCGVDEDEIQNKVDKARQNDVLGEEQMEELVPNDFLVLFMQKGKILNEKPAEQSIDPSKIYSSKSIVLQHLMRGDRSLGEEWVLMQRKAKERSKLDSSENTVSQLFKNKKLQIQIWHQIFNFISNNDDPPYKVIYNDFLSFCDLIQLPASKISRQQIIDIFFDYASAPWKNITALKIQQFAVVMEQISSEIYIQNQDIKPSDKITQLLLNNVYPMLCYYPQFRDRLNQRKIKTRNNYSENRQAYRYYSEQQLMQSPFMHSHQLYNELSAENKTRKKKFNIHRNRLQQQKLIEPNSDQYDRENKKKKEGQGKVVREKSCKVKIYEKYQEIRCCKGEEQDNNVIKRKKVKPWEILAVQCVRIMERKDSQWREQSQEQKIYEFKLILNNILIAVFKLADLYTYMQITLSNPKIGWQQYLAFSTLILEYRIQFYISLSLVVISVIVGLRGISFILEDRLGLTQNRIPAAFPHPMFFFTTIYKLLILSLFNTQIMTLLSTFMCNWQSTSTTFYMILNSQNTPLQCFSFQHNIYLICAIVGIFAYYPLSAYTMPNFQFAEKTLDLKYKPTYLIIYFQVNFILAAGKVLLAPITMPTLTSDTLATDIQSIQLVFQSLNILSLLFLAVSVRIMEPCLIKWFNYVEMLVILIGLIWNIMGMVLYLTDLWLMCLIVASCLTLALVVFMAIFIKKRFFSKSQIAPQAQQEQIQQLQQIWNTRKHHNVNMIRIKDEDMQSMDQQSVKPSLQQNSKHSQRNQNLQTISPRKQNMDTEYNLRSEKSSSKKTIQIDDVASDDSKK